MLSAISKRYHPSIGKSVTSFMVGRREKACYLPALQNDAIGPLRPIAALQFFGRYWRYCGHWDALEPEGSVANDPYATSGPPGDVVLDCAARLPDIAWRGRFGAVVAHDPHGVLDQSEICRARGRAQRRVLEADAD